MHAAAVLTSLAAFASFGWGVVRFFRKPSGPSARALAVAGLGLGFSVWNVVALAHSSAAPGLIAAGTAGHVLATLLFWSAIRACQGTPLTAIFEADVPVRVVSGGPYRWMRHPFYTSYTLFWFSGWIASGSAVSLAGALAMLAFYVQGAREEERKFAASSLKAQYDAYRRRRY
jgi:protein-S-isoprenylcysteine O-methyltransferase Ste14